MSKAKPLCIVYIHGNNATPACWNYVDLHLAEHARAWLHYTSAPGFWNNLARMKTELAGIEDIFLITHSLGGLYAVFLAEHLGPRLRGVVSLSAPFGGSRAADTLRLLSSDPVYRDIGPHCDPVRRSLRTPIQHPWTAVVSTRGHSGLIPEPNDGVISIASQESRRDVKYVRESSTHFEIVVQPTVVALIKNCIAAV